MVNVNVIEILLPFKIILEDRLLEVPYSLHRGLGATRLRSMGDDEVSTEAL
jgi:hypothetical protein